MNTTPSSNTGPSRCDHTSVGVLITSTAGLLVFDRATPPLGVAPVAGHIDQHGSPEQAARQETAEEVELAVTHLHLLLHQWRPNRCRRPTSQPPGHDWWIYQARTSGPLRPSAREVHAPRWTRPDQLQQLALRTAAYANGNINEHEFTERPGLQPVWVGFLHDLRLVTVDDTSQTRIEEIA
ncbi:NUDIX hydrolase [Spirillospora sp. NPDC047418]